MFVLRLDRGVDDAVEAPFELLVKMEELKVWSPRSGGVKGSTMELSEWMERFCWWLILSYAWFTVVSS